MHTRLLASIALSTRSEQFVLVGLADGNCPDRCKIETKFAKDTFVFLLRLYFEMRSVNFKNIHRTGWWDEGSLLRGQGFGIDFDVDEDAHLSWLRYHFADILRDLT